MKFGKQSFTTASVVLMALPAIALGQGRQPIISPWQEGPALTDSRINWNP